VGAGLPAMAFSRTPSPPLLHPEQPLLTDCCYSSSAAFTPSPFPRQPPGPAGQNPAGRAWHVRCNPPDRTASHLRDLTRT
jgi:hypothetical protein